MKNLLIIVFMALAVSAGAKDREALRADFRERSGERGLPAAADTTVDAWVNMAQQSIATLSGLLGKEWVDTFAGDYRLSPPADIRQVKRVKLWSEGRWYDMRVYSDSGMIPYDLTWDSATPSLFLDDNGYVQTYTDLLWNSDSTTYTLPADFREPVGFMFYSGAVWQSAFRNPLFLKDTAAVSYFTAWRAPDTAELYVKGGTWAPEGDTLRLFYLRGLQTGDSICVVYAGMPAEMTMDSMECELLDNLEVFVVDEAIRYYEMELKHYEVAALMWQQIRQDLGFTVQR